MLRTSLPSVNEGRRNSLCLRNRSPNTQNYCKDIISNHVMSHSIIIPLNTLSLSRMHQNHQIINQGKHQTTPAALLAKLLLNPNPLLPASLAQFLTCSTFPPNCPSNFPASFPTLYPALKLRAERTTTTPAVATQVNNVGVTCEYMRSSEEEGVEEDLRRRAFFLSRPLPLLLLCRC